jgi:hypothetical protein
MRRLSVCLLLLLGSVLGLFARSYREVPELTAIFQREGLPGTLFCWMPPPIRSSFRIKAARSNGSHPLECVKALGKL